jgi:hypothetical protein
MDTTDCTVPHSPPCGALLLQVDDPAGRVQRWVLGARVQGGVTGEAVGWGLLCQQTLLPQKRLRQGPLAAPVQLSWQVSGVPAKQLIPAAMQQDLVLRVRPKTTEGQSCEAFTAITMETRGGLCSPSNHGHMCAGTSWAIKT